MSYDNGRQKSDHDDGIHPFKAEVIADSSGKWCTNGISFATYETAAAYAQDLAMRWTAVRDWRVNSIGGVVVS